MNDAGLQLAKRMDYIAELKTAIRNMHGCESEYVETVPVTETFKGETLWNGDVEVFTIRGHPKAKRAYAWSHATGKNDQAKRYVAVLELPPVGGNCAGKPGVCLQRAGAFGGQYGQQVRFHPAVRGAGSDACQIQGQRLRRARFSVQ